VSFRYKKLAYEKAEYMGFRSKKIKYLKTKKEKRFTL